MSVLHGIHIIAGGQGGNRSVGGGCGQLADGFGSAVAGGKDPGRGGFAVFSGSDVSGRIQIKDIGKGRIVRRLSDGDKETADRQMGGLTGIGAL